MAGKANSRFQELLQDDRFYAFLMREFEAAATEATMEEIAEFAFGTLDDAVLEYESALSGRDLDAEDDLNETA
jgi:hypothetical protein